MSDIYTCSCGAKVRLPAQASSKIFRCPRCKTECTPALSVRVSAPPAHANATSSTCPICQSAILETEAVVACPSCELSHHQDCWQEIGGCSTYGCDQAPALSKETAEASRPLTAWGDTKKCPACGEKIKSIALRCRYCHTDFHTVDPLTANDLSHGVRRGESLRTLQTTVIVLFVISLSGCLAPLSLIIAPFIIIPKRKLLAKAGPFYLVLGYSALGLSVLYSVLLMIFLAMQ